MAEDRDQIQGRKNNEIRIWWAVWKSILVYVDQAMANP